MPNGYNSSGSGLLSGGGRTRQYSSRPCRIRRRPMRNFPDCHLKDWQTIREEVPDYEEGIEYTRRELILLAEKILINDPKPKNEHPAILLAPTYLDRAKREIFVTSGIPDPHIMSGLYWRTHPNGRKWWSKGDRVNTSLGRSFYR